MGYGADKQSKLITNALNWILDNHVKLLSDPSGLPFARYVLSTVSLLLKHPAFAAEEEVRFICSVSESESELIQYRVSAGHLVPYVSIAATEIAHSVGRLSGVGIDEIRCGPNVTDNAAAVLRDMTLLAPNYPRISRSEVLLVGRG